MRVIEGEGAIVRMGLTAEEVIIVLLNKLYQAGIVIRVLDENNQSL